MLRISLSKFLLVLTTLAVFTSCKKDGDPTPADNNPPEPTLRQASFQAEVTGDFEESISFTFDGTSVETSLLGTYKGVEDELSIYAIYFSGNNIGGVNLRSEMNAISVGVHNMDNFSWGQTSYENTGNSTTIFTIQSGTIEFTNVENAPEGLYGFLAGKYVAGNFSMALSNSNNQNVVITGSFSDVGVVIEN